MLSTETLAVRRVLCAAAILACAGAADAQVKISQIYGGGGNAGSTLKNDFIELVNAGERAVSLDGWTLQDCRINGATKWTSYPLPAITLRPGQYFLIGGGGGKLGSVELPQPDFTIPLNLHPLMGKIALVRSGETLVGACPLPGKDVEDFVGWGPVDCKEGAAPGRPTTNVTAIRRFNGGLLDTDDNGHDLQAAPPEPHTSGHFASRGGPSPTGACCVAGPTCSVLAAVDCAAAGGFYQGDGVACASVTCTNVAGGALDLVVGMGVTDADQTMRHIRSGVRMAGWTGVPTLQSCEFDNAGGLSHNGAGNLLAIAFGSIGNQALYQLATNGSNTVGLAAVSLPPRSVGLSVSPDNQHVALASMGDGQVYIYDYTAGAVGTGTGASATLAITGFAGASGESIGTAWRDNSTVVFVGDIGTMPTVRTMDRMTGTVTDRLPLPAFAHTGTSLSSDVEYNPDVSPYMYVVCSLFSGVSESRLWVLDVSGATWTIVRSIDLSSSFETTREIALGPDHRLYIAQFGGHGSKRLVAAIDLDLDQNGTISPADTLGLTDHSAFDVYRESAGEETSLNSRWIGIDVAVHGPAVAPVPGALGSCCLGTGAGCVALLGAAGPCTDLGGLFGGAGSTCGPCGSPAGACCTPASGACDITTEIACETSARQYFGDLSTCSPTACPGNTGACCAASAACTITTAEACFAASGFFHGVAGAGSSCSPVSPCTVRTDRLAQLPFASLVSQSNSPMLFGGGGGGPDPLNQDLFGYCSAQSNFSLRDGAALIPHGVWGLGFQPYQSLFAVANLQNDGRDGHGTAQWTYTIAGYSTLVVEIDAAAMGRFGSGDATHVPDAISITGSIDGGPEIPLFTSSIGSGPYFCRTLTSGTKERYAVGAELRDPLLMNGIELRNVPTRLVARLGAGNACAGVGAIGSTLTITLNATMAGKFKVFAFDGPRVLGRAAASNEVEPNDTFATADTLDFVPGASVTGSTIGTATTGDGAADTADYFRLNTPGTGGAGILRQRLNVTATANGYGGSLRGYVQTAGVVDPNQDTLAQNIGVASSTVRSFIWYAMGTACPTTEFRLLGGAATTNPYTFTMISTPVTPTVLPGGALQAGTVVFSTVGTTGSTQIDTGLALYDASFNPIAGAKNDDTPAGPGGSPPASLGSTLSTNLVPGTYYLAVDQGGIFDNQASPPTDDWRNQPVLAFPGVLVSGAISAGINLSFSATDSTGTRLVPAATTGNYEILFYRLDVSPCGVSTGPTITSPPPASAVVCPGGTRVLTVGATGSGTIGYRWNRLGTPLNDGPLAGGTILAGTGTPTLTINNAQSADMGLFQCVVTDVCGIRSSGNSNVIYCPADFNCSGGLTVQDVFAFLDAWFSGNIAADFNGGGLQVSDIFGFLNAWFAGC